MYAVNADRKERRAPPHKVGPYRLTHFESSPLLDLCRTRLVGFAPKLIAGKSPASQSCGDDAVCPAVGLIHYSDGVSLRLLTGSVAGWMDGLME